MEGKFGGDPKIVGKLVRINKQPYTIVGVTPEGFHGSEKILQWDIFVPLVNRAPSAILSAVVYHASAQDPLVVAAVVMMMALTGALSVAGPVRRALSLDPAVLLREQ